jgi:transposase
VEFNFIRSNADQVYLSPPDARDWLPRGHLAWQVLGAVSEMDLSAFLRPYRRDGQGAAAYHPEVMVALLLYCYSKGVRSSRAIEMASHDDVGARVILGNHHPDHATIARFVDRHQDQVKPLFVEVLAQCARAGLVTVDVVAGDGTKVKANASMTATVGAEPLDIDISRLESCSPTRWRSGSRRPSVKTPPTMRCSTRTTATTTMLGRTGPGRRPH